MMRNLMSCGALWMVVLFAAGAPAPPALAQDGGETPRQFIERREADLAPGDVHGHLELAD